MGFVAPLFLAGLLAVGLPLWLHRLQTQSSERRPFSSAMLLEAARQQVHVRRQLKYLLLLAARILLLVVLALAFAGPYLPRPPAAGASGAAGTHFVLVDTSASMGRAGVAGQVQAATERAIAAVPGDALIQVLGADRDLQVAGALTADRSVAASAARRLGSSALRLDFGEAMSAVERLAAGVPPPVTLHFISDFQASGMPVRFADVVPAGVSAFVPHAVGSGEPFNWSIDFIRRSGDSIEVGVRGDGDRERVAELALLINGTEIGSSGFGSAGNRLLSFELPELASGQNRVLARLDTDDDFRGDNRWHYVIDNDPPAVVPLVTLDPAGLPATYLAAALESTGRYRIEALVPGEFDRRILGRHRWLVVDDLGTVDAGLADALTQFMGEGGNMLAFAGERAAGLDALPVSGQRLAPLALAAGERDFPGIGQLESSHPALANTDGWRSVTVERSVPLAVGGNDTVLVGLEDGTPFLVESRVGQGRMLLVAAALDTRWSDFPARPVFVSFMVEAAGYLSGVDAVVRSVVAGAALPLVLAPGSAGQVVDPDGETVLTLADTTRNQQVRLDKPGFYEVYTKNGETTVAVNVDPRESALARVDADVLERWQAAIADQPPPGPQRRVAGEARTVELWHALLLALALLAIAEAALGNLHFSPRQPERA